MSSQEKGNNNAQWWQAQVMSTLGSDRWMRVGLRQLSGMLVMVFALSSLSVTSWSRAQHTLCPCNRGCIMPVYCDASSVHGAVEHTLCSDVQHTCCSCKGCIMPVCRGSSNMRGSVHGPSPDVILRGHLVMHPLYCAKTPATVFPEGQSNRHHSKLTPSLEASILCQLCTCT